MSRRLNILWIVAVAAVIAGANEAVAQGCAMCRTALQGQDESLLRAFNTSILFLVTMPYLIVGTVGGWVAWAVRRQHAVSELESSNEGDAE